MRFRRRPHDESETELTDAPSAASATARGGGRLPLTLGVAALIALIVMIALIIRDPSKEGSGKIPGLDGNSLGISVQDDQLTTAGIPDLPARLDRLAATGVTITRVDVAWADIAATRPADPTDPADPAYSWERTDAVLDGLQQRGIRVIVNFSAVPGWANGTRSREWAPEAGTLGSFATAFATRYTPERVDIVAYEPWNEPNNPGYLMPQWNGVGETAAPASPATYARLANEVEGALSDLGRRTALVGPSTADIDTSAPGVGGVGVTDFVHALDAVEDRPTFDLAAQHLQPHDGPEVADPKVPSLSTIPELLELLDPIAPGRDLLITRIGYATAPGGMSADQQATALSATFAALRVHPRVRLMVWGPLQDTIQNPAGLITTAGAEKPGLGVLTRTPKSLATETP